VSDHITLAKPAEANVVLAKRIIVRDGDVIGKTPSPNIKPHIFHEVPVHDLDSLMEAVQGGAAHQAIAVRGKPKAEVGRRAHHDCPEAGPAGLEVVPRRWAGLDWDKVRSSGDTARTRRGSCGIIRSSIPKSA
jgi:hypothetical protein